MSEALRVLWHIKKGVWFCAMSVPDCNGGHIDPACVRLTTYPQKFRGAKRCKNLRAKIEKVINDA